MIENIVTAIEDSIANFQKGVPGIQNQVYGRLVVLLKDFDTTADGRLVNSIKNLKLLQKIKAELEKAIVSKEYMQQSSAFIKSFDTVASLQNAYFKNIEKSFSPNDLVKAIKQNSIAETLEYLVGAGIDSNVISPVKDLIGNNLKSGSSFKDMTEQLREYITSTENGVGQLERYTTQITTDAINQYNASYSNTIADDLGLEWYMYTGSNLRTTRPFCKHLTDKKYVHASELDTIINDNIDGVKIGSEEIPINPKTGLARGMVAGTNQFNFKIYRGGYNCGHQLQPTSELVVPVAVRNKVYSTLQYKNWVALNKQKPDKKKQAEVITSSDSSRTKALV